MGYARHPLRSGVPALASLAANALIAAALLTLGMRSTPERRERTTLTVVSLAASESDQHAREQPRPAASAAQAESAPPPAAVPPAHAPMPALSRQTLLPAAVVAAPPLPGLAAIAPAPAAAARSDRASAAAPVVKGAEQPAAKPVAGDSRSYAAKVRSWIHAHKIYPRRSRMRREQGIVRVRFILDRAGLLVSGGIVEPSGFAALDEEAMAVLGRASPFPKAPKDLAGDRIEFVVPIEFALES